MNASEQIFSFHLVKLPLMKVPLFLGSRHKTAGLLHAERFVTMNLGAPIISPSRYNLGSCAIFAWWQNERFLDEHIQSRQHPWMSEGWHVRMKLYRRWGHISELDAAIVQSEIAQSNEPVVAVTLARLNLLQTFRFIKWGKPVERQVRDHQGQNLALAAIRPLGTFSTFSIWKNEAEMLSMVHGRDKLSDGESHKQAMQERNRKDFHNEFSTMRFRPFGEFGVWNGKSSLLSF